MRHYFTPILFVIFLGHFAANAQCDFSLLPDGALCSSAIYKCGSELNGLTGTLPATLVEPLPWDGLCDYQGSADNMIWFAFTPCDSTVTIRITPSNCQNAQGIQAGLYKRCGQAHSVACSPTVDPFFVGALNTFDLTWDEFVPGRTAYLFIDGMAGDICDYTIEVIDGIDTTPPQEVNPDDLEDGFVVGPNQINCDQTGDTLSYSLVLPTCLMNYVETCFPQKPNIVDSVCFVWHVESLGNGSYSFADNDSVGTDVKIIFNGDANDDFRISVDVNIHPYYGGGCAKGACGSVLDLLVGINPSILEEVNIELCPGETIQLCGNNVQGNTVLECTDSNNPCLRYRYTVTEKPRRYNDLGLIYRCSGTTYTFQGQNYSAAGQYNIQDPNECDLTHRFDLRFATVTATVAAGNTQIDCRNESITLSTVVFGDFPNDITYEWYLAGNLMGTGPSVSVQQPGRYSVIARMQNSLVSCQSSDFTDITLNKEKPLVQFENPMLSCRITRDRISYTTNTPLILEKWRLPNTPEVTGTTFEIDSLIAASGLSCRFEAERADNGCRIDTLLLIQGDFAKPTINILGDAVLNCLRDSVHLTAQYGALLPEFRRWTYENSEFINDQDDFIRPFKPGNYNLFVRAARNGCTNVNSKDVLEDRVYPKVELGEDLYWYCNTTSISLQPEVDKGDIYRYQWFQFDGGEIKGSLVAPDVDFVKPGTFYLEIGNKENYCLKIDSIVIREYENVPEKVLADLQDPVCFGENNGSLTNILVEGGDGPYAYVLNDKPITQTDLYNLQAGTYRLEVKDVHECFVSDTFELINPEFLEIEGIDDISIAFSEVGSVEAITNYDIADILSITWKNQQGEILGYDKEFFYDNKTSQSYTVEIVNLNGCTARTSFNVLVDNDVKFVISNAISPGSSLGNDKISISKNSVPADILDVQIFDRWGQKVFIHEGFEMKGTETKDIIWDGLFGGNELQSGVYVLYISYRDFFGNQKILTSDITLFR